MKHKIFYRIIAIVAMCITLFYTCNKNDDEASAGVEVTSVTLDKEFLTLPVGKTATFIATVLPENASNKGITWTSSDPTVVEAKNGWIAALRLGTATITATTKDGGKTASCHVTVTHEWEPEMVFVEGGTFMMGCTDDECFNWELPTHQVTVSSFSIGKYLITQKQWEFIVGRTIEEQAALTGCTALYGVGDDYPMYYLKWEDMQEFIQKLNDATGKQYRLATEAEWEFAARGGNKSKGYKYSGGDDIDVVAWHYDNSDGTSHPVGTKAPNELGIYDMSGNLSEWCNDWHSYYTEDAQINPQGPSEGAFHVYRNGSWVDKKFNNRTFRVSYRNDTSPNSGYPYLDFGFRVVLSH